MAAMTTVLTSFSEYGNKKTYTYTGHTALDPRLVIQSRKVASNGTSVIEDTIMVLSGTVDSGSVPLAARVSFTATVRRPVNGSASVVTAALAIFRDVVAGDEFSNNLVTKQGWIK